MGEAVGVSAQAVSKWEKGDSLPDISVIPDICRTFGISADALLGNEGNMTSEMYVEKALELCKDMDEKMYLLHKIMYESVKVNDRTEKTPHLWENLWAGHIFSIEDSRGFGMFLSNIEYVKKIMSVDLATNKLLKFMSDKKSIKIFELICLNGRLSENEIIKMTGLSEQEVAEQLFSFIKCSVIESVMETENEMAYAVAQNGVLLIGIMANAFLFDPESRKGEPLSIGAHTNVNPDKLRRFIN